MKITTLLSYASAAALVALVAGLFTAPEALIAGGAFIGLLSSLMVVRDYTPRNYFVVTTPTVASAKPRLAAPAPGPFGTARPRSAHRRIALVS